ncbi:MAG TPA: ABC transporter permease, partial [Roseiarcus sp.]|nr:ABC transporter permease [Roseiarcus sp.]
MIRDDSLASRLWRAIVWLVAAAFVANLFALIAVVVLNSFATRWLGAWLPSGFTPRWYSSAWSEFQLGDVLIVTFEVVFAVVALSGLVGVGAAYALARRDFPGKRAVMLLFLAPLVIPPLTYGVPMASLLYRIGLGGTFYGVVLANLVPTIPFVVLVMTPFIEQIDPRIEAA